MGNVLAIDPGGTIGIATTADGETFSTFTTTTAEELWWLVAAGAWDMVLCENFAAQTISKYGLHTVRLVGGVQAVCLIKAVPLTMRTPQDRRAWQEFAQKHLEERRTRTKERFVVHQADALAHLMSWLHWKPA